MSFKSTCVCRHLKILLFPWFHKHQVLFFFKYCYRRNHLTIYSTFAICNKYSTVFLKTLLGFIHDVSLGWGGENAYFYRQCRLGFCIHTYACIQLQLYLLGLNRNLSLELLLGKRKPYLEIEGIDERNGVVQWMCWSVSRNISNYINSYFLLHQLKQLLSNIHSSRN